MTATNETMVVTFLVVEKSKGVWAACCVDQMGERCYADDRHTQIEALNDVPEMMNTVSLGMKQARAAFSTRGAPS